VAPSLDVVDMIMRQPSSNLSCQRYFAYATITNLWCCRAAVLRWRQWHDGFDLQSELQYSLGSMLEPRFDLDQKEGASPF